jgi:predicted DsbA family dithiol-disulfide isomerase
VARLAHKMAIANEHVMADVVEVNEFLHLAQKYAIRGVPKTVINESVEFMGNVSESQFLTYIQRAAESSGNGRDSNE